MTLLETKKMSFGTNGTLTSDPKKDYVVVRIEGKSTKVDKKELWLTIFMIAEPEQQEKLLTVKKTEMTIVPMVHNVKLTKDMKAGEILVVKCRTNLPSSVIEQIEKDAVEGAKLSTGREPIPFPTGI